MYHPQGSRRQSVPSQYGAGTEGARPIDNPRQGVPVPVPGGYTNEDQLEYPMSPWDSQAPHDLQMAGNPNRRNVFFNEINPNPPSPRGAGYNASPTRQTGRQHGRGRPMSPLTRFVMALNASRQMRSPSIGAQSPHEPPRYGLDQNDEHYWTRNRYQNAARYMRPSSFDDPLEDGAIPWEDSYQGYPGDGWADNALQFENSLERSPRPPQPGHGSRAPPVRARASSYR